jgi:hypothetical protein
MLTDNATPAWISYKGGMFTYTSYQASSVAQVLCGFGTQTISGAEMPYVNNFLFYDSSNTTAAMASWPPNFAVESTSTNQLTGTFYATATADDFEAAWEIGIMQMLPYATSASSESSSSSSTSSSAPMESCKEEQKQPRAVALTDSVIEGFEQLLRDRVRDTEERRTPKINNFLQKR